jgi:excisionase family DNA binding protein
VSAVPIPSLDAIAADPAMAAVLPVEARGALIVQAAAVLAALGAGMLHEPEGRPDQLLTVEEASERLRLSKDYLYRHARRLPFFVETGARAVRFSEHGIERYLRQHQERQTS